MITDSNKKSFIFNTLNRASNGPRFFWTRTEQIQTRVFSLIVGTFCVHGQIKDRDFSYLLVTLREKSQYNVTSCCLLSHSSIQIRGWIQIGSAVKSERGPGPVRVWKDPQLPSLKPKFRVDRFMKVLFGTRLFMWLFPCILHAYCNQHDTRLIWIAELESLKISFDSA
jgi:hypothetical protein